MKRKKWMDIVKFVLHPCLRNLDFLFLKSTHNFEFLRKNRQFGIFFT